MPTRRPAVTWRQWHEPSFRACAFLPGIPMTDQTDTSKAPRGAGSFCVPRVALEALLNAKASAYEICTYLVLAKYTDESGRYSPASISAVNKATGSNKLKDGPVGRALERLKTIRAASVKQVSNGRSGKSHALVDQTTDLGPILLDRETALAKNGGALPDGPTERGMVRFYLPDFGEEMDGRVWFGNNLVSGVGGFAQPLKALKNAGDAAARLLLSLYAANDMEIWGGVRPTGAKSGPHKRYEPVVEDANLRGGVRLIRAKDSGELAWIDSRISGGVAENYWDALRALKSAGFVYEVVVVLNRNAAKLKFASGEEYGGIPDGAEPYYELDAKSDHGYKPSGEEGIGGAVANTAGACGCPVTLEGGRFDGTYAAMVPSGFGAMIAGIYRLRFRVANPRNAGVSGAWARIHQNNRDAFDLVAKVRVANGLTPLVAPWSEGAARASTNDEAVA